MAPIRGKNPAVESPLQLTRMSSIPGHEVLGYRRPLRPDCPGFFRRLFMKVLFVVLTALIMAISSPAQELKAGYAKVDVTPVEPVYMGGYSLRNAPSDGVHGQDKLYVRALVFDNGKVQVAFVEADVIGIQGHDVFRREIADATGIPYANVLLGDVHNHAAPSPRPGGGTAWERQFEKALLTAAKEAAGNLQPVRTAAGSGRSRIAMNRRQVRPSDQDSPLTFDENDKSQSFGQYRTDRPVSIHEFAGVVRLGANPEGPIDDAVEVVRIDTAQGKPLAVMIHYPCHGTTLGGRNSKISGEWMGRMQAFVESRFPGVGAIYLQGAAGDINPRVVGGLDGHKDDVSVTWALGEEIGAEVARVYRTLAPSAADDSRIQLETKEIVLPRQYRELFDDFKNTGVRVPTTAVRIANLMWVTFPGEMFSAIGKRVKAASPATYPHLMGYTNGSVGYFPEQKAYAEGGYEVARTHMDPAAERIYLRELTELLERFR